MRILLLIGLFVLLGAGVYSLRWQHEQEAALVTQLAQYNSLLAADNRAIAQTTGYDQEHLQSLDELYYIDHHDRALVLTARQLTTLADSIVASLHRQARAARPGNASPSQRQQLTNYTTFLHTRLFTQPPVWASPDVAHLLPIVAKATLVQLEQQVLTTGGMAIKQLLQQLHTKKVEPQLRALTAAESNQVAPGGTYRARLFLANVLPMEYTRMRCNGQPVVADSTGIGRVRFIAPHQPGLAHWQGEIIVKRYGRDTTFIVQVPYRVAQP